MDSQGVPKHWRSGRFHPFLTTAVAVLIASIAVGYAVYWWQQRVMEDEARRASESRAKLESGVLSLRRALKPQRELEARTKTLEDEVEALRHFSYGHTGRLSPQYLAIYGPDRTYDPARVDVVCYVVVPENLPMPQKLRYVADRLSWLRFDGCPIHVLRIEDRGGKRIAVVDIREPEGANDRWSWATGYFQGSSGGGVTQRTLVLTFLQKDRPGAWIDGVQFYYQGKPFSPEWDHINLTGTFYRNRVRE